MKYIAHRGLFQGPDRHLENQPQQIRRSLERGYDAEIDLWVFEDRLYLGHDGPQYNVTRDFLEQPGLWIHAKNLVALEWLTETKLNYFWHQEDHYTMTSWGWIWAYPGQPTSSRCVQVMPEMANPQLGNLDWTAHAICSDWIERIQAQRP